MMQLLVNEVHIWRITLAEHSAQIAQYEAVLKPEEQARAYHYHFAKDQQRYMITRAVLRLLLGKYLQRDPQKIEFILNAHGKPHINDNELYFNVSHSGDYAMIAISKQAVGVDLEKIVDRDSFEIAERFFLAEEVVWLRQLKAQTDFYLPAFYYLWAAKEAYCKLLGESIFNLIREISVSLPEVFDPQNFPSARYITSNEVSLYNWCPLSAWPSYIAGVAVNSSVNQLQTFDWQGIKG